MIVWAFAAWALFVVSRLLKSPLPHPADVVHLSLLFYNVPLALVALSPAVSDLSPYTVFLNAVAGDARIAQQTLLLVSLASVAVEVGRAAGRIPVNRNGFALAVPVSSAAQQMTALITGAAMVTVLGGILLFGVSAFLAGYATESSAESATSGTALIFFSYEVVGLSSFVWFYNRGQGAPSSGRTVIYGTLLFLVVITVLRGKRLELIIALLPLLLILAATKFTSVRSRLVVATIGIVAISALASIRQGEIPDGASLAFNTLSEGLYAGHVTPALVESVDTGRTRTENGLRVLGAFVALVPRFVFPTKDETVYKALTDVSQFAPLGASSMLAEVYLQGRVAAVIAFFLIVGYLAQKLCVTDFSRSSNSLPIKTIIYVIFVCSFIPHFRDGLMTAIKIPLQLIVVATVIIILSSRQLVRTPRYPLAPNRRLTIKSTTRDAESVR